MQLNGRECLQALYMSESDMSYPHVCACTEVLFDLNLVLSEPERLELEDIGTLTEAVISNKSSFDGEKVYPCSLCDIEEKHSDNRTVMTTFIHIYENRAQN